MMLRDNFTFSQFAFPLSASSVMLGDISPINHLSSYPLFSGIKLHNPYVWALSLSSNGSSETFSFCKNNPLKLLCLDEKYVWALSSVLDNPLPPINSIPIYKTPNYHNPYVLALSPVLNNSQLMPILLAPNNQYISTLSQGSPETFNFRSANEKK